MKKLFLLILCLGSFSFLFSEELETVAIERNMPITGGRFLLMDDFSMWVVIPVVKKKRSFLQWVRRVQIPQPEENFLFDLDEWKPGTELSISEHLWTEVDQADMEKYHQPLIANCPFMMVNFRNQQAAFARQVTLNQALDLFSEFAANMYKAGKENGYKKGKKDGYSDGEVVGFNLGKITGYNNGYNNGYNKGYYNGSKNY